MTIKDFWIRFKFKKVFLALIFVFCLAMLWRFTSVRRQSRVCNMISVQIDNAQENHFIEENDILALLSGTDSEPITGRKLSEINLPVLEQNLLKNRFVHQAQVWTDVAGNLAVRVEQARPIARILRSRGRDVYIGSEGQLLPISSRYTARVPVLSGSGVGKFMIDTLAKTSQGLVLMAFLNFIHKDNFWQVMISQIEIDNNGQVFLFPQIGKQVIEFGNFEDIELKFYKLKLFYKKIIPKKGWNAYSRVKLKFDGQIVCES